MAAELCLLQNSRQSSIICSNKNADFLVVKCFSLEAT